MDGGQLALGVDAERLGGIGEAVEDHPLAGRRGGGRGVGQVQLALGVVRRQAVKIGEDRRRAESVEPGVDGRHRQLRRPGVGDLDDPLQQLGLAGAGRGGDHPAEGAGRGQVGHRQRPPGAVSVPAAAVPGRLQPAGQGIEGRRPHQRRVAGEDQQGGVAGRVGAVEEGLDLSQGVAGAPLLGLLHPHQVFAGEGGAHLGAAVTDHHQDALAAGGAGGGENPGEERPARRRVEHLGPRRAQAFALAGGEDHRHPAAAGGGGRKQAGRGARASRHRRGLRGPRRQDARRGQSSPNRWACSGLSRKLAKSGSWKAWTRFLGFSSIATASAWTASSSRSSRA